MRASRAQAIYVLVIGIASLLAGGFFAWIDSTIHKGFSAAALMLALGLFATLGGTINLMRASRVGPAEPEGRWKL